MEWKLLKWNSSIIFENFVTPQIQRIYLMQFPSLRLTVIDILIMSQFEQGIVPFK